MSGLKKKLGPLPVWAWILIAGTAIGLIWYEHSKNSSTSSSTTTPPTSANSVDPATGLTYVQKAQEQASGIDPLTGIPYAVEDSNSGSSGGGGGDSMLPGNPSPIDQTSSIGTYPSLGQEISDITSVMQGLQALGLITPTPQADSGPSSLGASAPQAPTRKPAAPAPVKTFTDKLGHGVAITSRPASSVHPGRNETVKPIGHGLNLILPKPAQHKRAPKPKTRPRKPEKTTNARIVRAGR